MAKTFQDLWNDVVKLKEDCPDLPRKEMMPILKAKGYTSEDYKRIFADTYEMKSFFCLG